MALEIRELLDKRAKLVADGRKIVDAAEAEKRDMTEEQNAEFKRHMDEADKLTDKISNLEKLQRHELEGEKRKTETAAGGEGKPVTRTQQEEQTERRNLFKKFLLRGKDFLSTDEIRTLATIEDPELRAMQAGDATHGGSLLVPQMMVNEILKVVDSKVVIGKDARTFNDVPLTGMGVPVLVNQPTDPEWTPELTAPTKGTGLSFGGRELRPRQLTKEELVSNVLLQNSKFDIEGLLIERVGYKFTVAEDNLWLNGTGSGQPLGLMTASAQGIDTDRDVTIGTSTDPTFDGLIDLQSGVKAEYWPTSKFYVSRAFLQKLRKIKDGEGQYIWNVSVKEGQPNVILGQQYEITDQMPSTFTAGQYVALFGDMKYYWIARCPFAYLQRLVELYAETNQTAFVFRRFIDGMPVLSEAFARGKLA